MDGSMGREIHKTMSWNGPEGSWKFWSLDLKGYLFPGFGMF